MDKREQAIGEEVCRVEIEGALSPDERLVVLPLMPVRGCNLHQQPWRPWSAHERLLLEVEAFVEPS